MVKKIIKTNPNLIELINKLNKKSKTERIWEQQWQQNLWLGKCRHWKH